ncbi:formate dehydrogenase accessory sulfurtransferase FdhD [Solwaraspora sp. WMMD791]|uniref:formate dehydrogenase accessory sulfurtransferase FdhD n=1 Tax=Solwaraspora sp. WMMD791 TaxID=3016086 RepID=UPI00249AC417|nr:formate dehydrogenase accessory sulfurtransferase FdhD [Solwaraspora sp. WMMD791]WFE25613.1 formate dehydrogenase accessory sulfurtransferase FdhD [Solwaraspora sp. WMMD791]
MGRASERRTVLRIEVGNDSGAAGTDGSTRQVRRMDTVAGEEPLEIRVGPAGPARRRPLAVTMRTPGNDIDLAIGFLLTEGLIGAADDVVTAQLCAGTDTPNTYNVVDVTLAGHVPPPETDPARNFYTTSSCGVCGKASIDAVRTRSRFDVAADRFDLDPWLLAALPDRLRAAQQGFDRTGGLHAAGLFTTDGQVRVVREDVGRHNAVDKVVGWAAREGLLPLRGHLLLVSGRASFELTQKAWMAGIPVLAAISAPSSLAVALAEEAGMTLVGFLRDATMNVYAGADRLAQPLG